MKKIILILLALFISNYSAYSQAPNKFKLSINIGVTGTPEFGLLTDIEPKYNITSRSSIGLQFRGIAVIGRAIKIPANSEFEMNSRGYSAFSIMATYEIYLGKEKSKFQPFLGGGLGYFKASNEDEITSLSDPENILNGTVKGQLGVNLRTGVDLGRFRLGLDYNIIPKSDLVLTNGQTIAKVNDSYLGFSIGFTFGARNE